MQVSVDLSKPVLKPQLYLCKPNRQIVAKLNEAIIPTHKLKLASINELEFSIPSELEIKHQLQANPNLNKVKDRYLIKFVKGDYVEWYLINTPAKATNDTTDGLTVHAFSLGYELASKTIRNYKSMNTSGNESPINCTHALTDVLSQTLWTIDYVDASFDILFRSFNISSSTVLDAVNQIASTFVGLVIWDTENRKISMYNPDTFGVNRGLRYSANKLMKGVEVISSSDEMVTRLKVFGKDDISIQSVNPTGANYIEDFSYFMNLDYMSQGLIDAMISYNALVTSVQGAYATYLSELKAARETLTTKQNELADLNTAMSIILNNLDIAQTTGADATALLAQKASQQALIDSKQSEIDSTNASIASVNSQIATLQVEISIENNFTQDQIDERNLYIIEKEISNTNISIPQDLYDYAVTEFSKIREPQLSVKVDVVNFLEVPGNNNQDKLILGDICTVYYPKLNINVKAKIVEIDFNYENASIALTISNVTLVMDDEQKFVDNLYNSISTSSEVQINKSAWDNIGSVQNDVADILNNAWESAKNQINSGVNNSVTVNSRGIIISDSTDPNKFIRATNGVIGLTGDGGNTFSTAIDYTGVYAQRLVGQIILGNNLTIDSSVGSTEHTFVVDSNGVAIKGSALTITSSGSTGNGISLSPEDGLVIQKTNGTTTLTNQIILNATDGFSASKNTGTYSSPVWSKKLYFDLDGNLTVAGNIIADTFTANTKLLVGSIDVGDFITNGINAKLDLLAGTASNLHVASANIDGALTAGQITVGSGTSFSSGYDPTTKTSVGDVVTIIDGTVTASYIEALSVTAQRLTAKTPGGIIVTDIYKDDLGGKVLVYDASGNLDAKIGTEAGTGTGANRAGTMILYDDAPLGSDETQYIRVAAGISTAYGDGRINLKGSNNITRVAIYADSINHGGAMALFSADATLGSQIVASGTSYFNGGGVAIGKITADYALDVVGDINFTGTLRLNGVPFTPVAKFA